MPCRVSFDGFFSEFIPVLICDAISPEKFGFASFPEYFYE
jgi:hypothetical protein